MAIMTGLSGNEIYCLNQKGLAPGDLVIGNSVFSVGFLGSIGSGLRTLAGGEVTQITSVIHEGRQKSYERMVAEAQKHGGVGITGVGDHPYRATGVESALAGTTAAADAIAAAAAHAADGVTVNSDIHASAEYRTAMAAVITRRAIQKALARVA